MQKRNPELVDILRTDFQHRNEPNFAWKSAVSSLQIIPGIVAAWPMSVVRLDSQIDRVRDVGGGGYHLTTFNTPDFGYDNLVPYMDLDGTNQYAERTAGAASWASVTGAEGHILAAQQGLFFGGWFRFDEAAPPAAQEILIGKRTAAAGNYSYWLRRDTVNGFAFFHTTNDGTALTTIDSNPTVLEQNIWYWIAGSFDNTANLNTLWVNNETFTVANNNTIFDGNADFAIGSRSGGAGYLDGRASLCFLSQIAASNAIAFSVYQQQRAAFVR
jgi:hypothetical protein